MSAKRVTTFANLVTAVAFAPLAGCVSAQYMTTERLEVTQKTTKEGTQVIAAERKPELAETNVIEPSSTVKTVTKITNFDVKDKERVYLWRFDISPDGSRLVMCEQRLNGESFTSQLVGIGKDGGSRTKITEGNYRDVDPSYSSNGKFIYFATDRGDSRFKIWRIRSSGTGGLTKITSGSTVDAMPSESPDRERVTYQSLMDGDPRWQVWSSNTTGALPTQMTVGGAPVYSPDGSKILYSKPASDKPNETAVHIWVMDADGSNLTQMTDGDSVEMHPTWTPSGNRILYASNAGKSAAGKKNFDIYVMNADGTGRTQLTTNGSYDVLPVMDPSGKYVYFLSNRGVAWNIWRMELVAADSSDTEKDDPTPVAVPAPATAAAHHLEAAAPVAATTVPVTESLSTAPDTSVAGSAVESDAP